MISGSPQTRFAEIITLIVVGIAVYLAVGVFRKKLQSITLKLSSSNPRTQPESSRLKILHYAVNIGNTLIRYGLFQKGDSYWIVNVNDISNPINLHDIYPHFKGRPLGFISLSHQGKDSFMIFSSDGKVYNPYTVSNPWRSDFFYLPYKDFIAVDARPLAGAITSGLFNAGVSDILFRFYFASEYIEESGCSPGTDLSDVKKKSCTSKTVPFVHPPFNAISFFHLSDDLYALSSDGWIYTLSTISQVWKKDLQWTDLFSGLVLPDSIPLTEADKSKMELFGADYEYGVPIFIIRENNKYFIVDRDARKYDLRKMFKSLSGHEIVLPGNIIDFTKIGPGELDYLIALTDGNLYGPKLKGPKPLSDFIGLAKTFNWGNLVSLTSVNKWAFGTGGTFKYYLVFLFDTGMWFEAEYSIADDRILSFGQDHTVGGLWNQWPHVKNVLSRLTPTQRYKISSQGWSVFVYDHSNENNNQVYSIGGQPESWKEMMYCTPDGNGEFKTSACVGLGKWKDYQYSSGNDSKNAPVVSGAILYPEQGTLDGADFVLRKTSRDDCLKTFSSNSIYGAFVYDSVESDGYFFKTLVKLSVQKNPDLSTYVRPEYDATFQNRFCVKHLPTGKYLYWDFADTDKQFIGLSDKCIYSVPNIQNITNPDDYKNLVKSMGAMWSFDGKCLDNMNGALGGSLQSDMTLDQKCNTDFVYSSSSGQLGNGSKCLVATNDGKNFSYSDCPSSPSWKVESIPCPTFNDKGYIYEYCSRT